MWGTQISVWTYTNYYIPDELGVTQEVALQWHTAALVLFACSRWIFTGMMKFFKASSLLIFASIMACVMTLIVTFVGGIAGVVALVCISGFMSLMFPTIFGLGCSGLGQDTKLASSGQIMAIVGGRDYHAVPRLDGRSVGESVTPIYCRWSASGSSGCMLLKGRQHEHDAII